LSKKDIRKGKKKCMRLPTLNNYGKCGVLSITIVDH
jgi:hypothetical protein